MDFELIAYVNSDSPKINETHFSVTAVSDRSHYFMRWRMAKAYAF